MNAERVRNGYEPVNYRKGYFPHFQPGEGDGMGKRYTNEQKGVLWQMATGSKSTKNNPYSKETGQKWIDARNAAKEGS